MAMHSIDAERCHVLFDAALPPVLTIDSGDVVTFKTLDACWGEVRSVEDFARYRAENRRGSNPITGPVFVRGARPGGVLKVEILQIDLDETGFQLIGPNRALIRDEVPDWTCYVVHVRDDRITLANGLTLPADPVIGELGNAPAGKPTNLPNPSGGNLDCPFIRRGATVYLPVQVEGALFSVGDVHARQGDGEIVGAPEIGASVTLRFSFTAEPSLTSWPLVEDADHWHVIASAGAEAEAEAIRIAVFEAAEFVRRRNPGTTLADALILLTMIAKIHCCRTGPWGDHGPVASVAMPKALLPNAPPIAFALGSASKATANSSEMR